MAETALLNATQYASAPKGRCPIGLSSRIQRLGHGLRLLGVPGDRFAFGLPHQRHDADGQVMLLACPSQGPASAAVSQGYVDVDEHPPRFGAIMALMRTGEMPSSIDGLLLYPEPFRQYRYCLEARQPHLFALAMVLGPLAPHGSMAALTRQICPVVPSSISEKALHFETVGANS